MMLFRLIKRRYILLPRFDLPRDYAAAPI